MFCFNTDNHRHLFTFFFNCNARKYGENSSWRRKLMKIVFCFLFASFFQTQIHKHSRSLLYNCWRRIEEGFSSFFFFLQEKLEKRWNSVGFSSVNIVDFFCGFHRDVLLLLKLYTLVEEPSLDQISQALQATVFCN